MTTLAKHIIVAGAENHPPMLEKSMYDSWASRILLFIKGNKHGRMMLDSIDNGPLVYPTIKENGKLDLRNTPNSLKHNNFKMIVMFKQQISFFMQGKDLIECINKAMKFLSVVALWFPPSNNQLKTSSNPRNQATIQDGRVTVQQVQRRQHQSYAGEGHMARQCTQPKRSRNTAWFKEKLMLAEAQEAGQIILDEEQLAFLADHGISEAPVAHQTIPQNLAFQTDDLDAYDSNCNDLSSAKAVLMANLLSCDPEVLSKVQTMTLRPHSSRVRFITSCSNYKDILNHQDSRIEKAQELKTNTFVNSDVKDLSSETKLRGRLIESFQEDAKYKHVGQDTSWQGGKVNLIHSKSNVHIPLDSWTSGLLVYKEPLSSLKMKSRLSLRMICLFEIRPHYTKDFPLREEGKTLEENYYMQFGRPFQGGDIKRQLWDSIKRNNENSSYQERRQSMEGASIKTLEIQIGQVSSSTEANLRDQVKSISTTIEVDSCLIHRIRSAQYAVSIGQNRTLMYESRRMTILFPSHLNGYYYEEKKGSYGLQFSEAYSEAS
nr:hypothetical protein [Tanacetum cinerariifolium]